jgi:hypothetical protein
MTNIFGIEGLPVKEYAIAANTIVGTRDSGKTYSGTKAAEELYDAGIPFVVFDPIGKWHSLRIPGKGPGYPIVVAGGKFADLPLTPDNAVEIIRAAMSERISVVMDLFSPNLSKADWRKIVCAGVETLLHENDEYGLRHVFIEEAAEFVPQKPMDFKVFSAVEKMVRMGGNSKLGCTLINQRSADLNKSVLELCANVFVHRQRGKNTILDLRKWIDLLGVEDGQEKEIGKSLPNLPSGECWALMADVGHAVRLKVPEKNSKHPDRRETVAQIGENGAGAPRVDVQSFVERLKADLAEEAKEDEAVQHPQSLDHQIALNTAHENGKHEGYNEGWQRGYREGWQIGRRRGQIESRANFYGEEAEKFAEAHKIYARELAEIPDANAAFAETIREEIIQHPPHGDHIAIVPEDQADSPDTKIVSVAQRIEPRNSTPKVAGSNPAGHTIMSKMARKALDQIHASYPIPVTYAFAALRAGISRKSSAYPRYEAEIAQSGEVERNGEKYRSRKGYGKPMNLNGSTPLDAWADRLGGSPGKILRALRNRAALSRPEIANKSGISPTSSGLGKAIVDLHVLGLIEETDSGFRLSEALR